MSWQGHGNLLESEMPPGSLSTSWKYGSLSVTCCCLSQLMILLQKKLRANSVSPSSKKPDFLSKLGESLHREAGGLSASCQRLFYGKPWGSKAKKWSLSYESLFLQFLNYDYFWTLFSENAEDKNFRKRSSEADPRADQLDVGIIAIPTEVQKKANAQSAMDLRRGYYLPNVLKRTIVVRPIVVQDLLLTVVNVESSDGCLCAGAEA